MSEGGSPRAFPGLLVPFSLQGLEEHSQYSAPTGVPSPLGDAPHTQRQCPTSSLDALRSANLQQEPQMAWPTGLSVTRAGHSGSSGIC